MAESSEPRPVALKLEAAIEGMNLTIFKLSTSNIKLSFLNMSVKFLLFFSTESLGANRFKCTLELRLAFEILKVILQGSLGLASNAAV